MTLKYYRKIIGITISMLGIYQIGFSQTTLAFYLDASKQNSPLINDNRNLSKANQLEAERLKAFYTKPQIGLTANYLFSPIITSNNGSIGIGLNSKGADKYLGYDLGATNGGQYQVMVNIAKPLFNEGRYKTVNEQLMVGSQIYENNSKLTAHDLEKIITDQYILCLQDNKQIQYAESMTKLLSEQQPILKKLVESSIYKQSDLILFEIEYQNFLGQLSVFKANFKRDLMDLNILCGINDTTIVELKNEDLSLNKNIENPLFLEKFRLDSLNLLVQQKIFELKYKPQVSLFANSGLNAVYLLNIPSRVGFSAGLSFSYNFFDGNQKAINKSKTDVLLKSISFYRNNFVNQNTIRKTKILNELQSFTERTTIAEQQLKDYQFLLNAFKKEIISGQMSIINYITTLKNMEMIQRDFTLLSSQKQSLINAYNYWNW